MGLGHLVARRGQRIRPRRSRPESSISTSTARSSTAASSSIRRGEASAQGAVAAPPQAGRRGAREGWDPEEHPRSVKSGRTNDEVKAEPEALWRSDRPASEAKVDLVRSWDPPTEAELQALDALEGGRRVGVPGPSAEVDQPRQGALSRPRRRGAGHQTGAGALPRDGRAVHAPVPDEPAAQPAPVPERRRPSGLLAQGPSQVRAGLDHAAGTTPRPIPAKPSGTPSPTARRRWPGWPTTARSSFTHGPRPSRTCTDRPGRSSTSTPARRTRSTTSSCWPASIAPRSITSNVVGGPKVTGQRGIQIWIPVADGLQLRRHQSVGGDDLAGDRGNRARARELGVEEDGPRRSGPPRLHAERHQPHARRAVQRPTRARRAGLGADHAGPNWTTPSYAPTGGRFAPSSTGSTRPAIPSLTSSDASRRCHRSNPAVPGT